MKPLLPNLSYFQRDLSLAVEVTGACNNGIPPLRSGWRRTFQRERDKKGGCAALFIPHYQRVALHLERSDSGVRDPVDKSTVIPSECEEWRCSRQRDLSLTLEVTVWH